MKISQVGAQLYTVRDHLKGSPAFARTIERLKAIGYSLLRGQSEAGVGGSSWNKTSHRATPSNRWNAASDM